jgi:hypothetical protein
MKNQRAVVVFLLLLFSYPAWATDYSILTVNLVLPDPTTHPFINQEDCANSTTFDLRISWAFPISSTAYTFYNSGMKTDVFLSTSSTCSSVSVSIVDSTNTTVDYTDKATSGEYPDPDQPSTQPALTLSKIAELKCDTPSQTDYYFCIKFSYKYTNLYGSEVTDTIHGGAKIRFDNEPPSVPTLGEVNPGEGNLKISWESGDEDDLGGFKVFYRSSGSGEDPKEKDLSDGSATSYQIKGLTNGQAYEVWVRAFDASENVSEDSEVRVGTPEPVKDFFEYYKESGGQEKGGYCFVATAAFGSNTDSTVMVLRAFRDRILMSSELGRSFVSGYYRYGPRWARAIRGADLERTVARWSLSPAVWVAGASQGSFGKWIALGLGFIALCSFGLIVWRRRMARMQCGKLLVLLVPILLIFGRDAKASDLENTEPQSKAEKQAKYQFGLRLGSYYPSIDGEENISGKPFKDIFGGGSELLLELGADYEIGHWFGTLTVGGTVGFVQYLGKGRLEQGDASTDTTVFNLVPFRIHLGYHMDFIAERLHIPLVPYVLAGITYCLWWSLDGVGNVSKWQDASGGSFEAKGGIFGTHWAVGMKFLLDVLDEASASNLQKDTGVINSYLFAEYMSSVVDNFGSKDHFNLGAQSVMFGLMMEF